MFTTIARQTKVVAVMGLFALGACSTAGTGANGGGYEDNTTGRVVDARDRYERLCVECGTVRSVTQVSGGEGRTTGAGAVIGAIIGGVAGHQVGGGTGQDIATVAGAVGGAVAGNAVESNRNQNEPVYEVLIRMEDGSERLITVADASGIRTGDAVTVDGSEITIR